MEANLTTKNIVPRWFSNGTTNVEYMADQACSNTVNNFAAVGNLVSLFPL